MEQQMQPVEDGDNKGGGSIIGLIIGLALIIYVLSVILG